MLTEKSQTCHDIKPRKNILLINHTTSTFFVQRDDLSWNILFIGRYFSQTVRNNQIASLCFSNKESVPCSFFLWQTLLIRISEFLPRDAGSTKRCIATVSRPSVRPSVCDADAVTMVV